MLNHADRTRGGLRDVLATLRTVALIIVGAAAFALLFGCAAPQPPQPPQPTLPAQPLAGAAKGLRLDATATLATNACEAAVAGDYTRVIVVRKRAAAALRAGRIRVDVAEALQAQADRARALLDAACPGGQPDHGVITRARIAAEGLAARAAAEGVAP